MYEELVPKIMEEFSKFDIVPHTYPNAIGMWPCEMEDLVWGCLNAPNKDFLEIGSFHGGSAVLMCLVKKYKNEGGFVNSIDRKFDPMFKQNVIDKGHFHNISCQIECDSLELDKYFSSVGCTNDLGFVLIDGWHSFKGAYLDFQTTAKHLVAGSMIAFHDVDKFESEDEIDFFYKDALKNYDYYMSEPLPNPNADEQSFNLEQLVAYIIRTYKFELIRPPNSKGKKRPQNEWKPGRVENNSLVLLKKP